MMDAVGFGVVALFGILGWRQIMKFREKAVARATEKARALGYEVSEWGKVPEAFREAFRMGLEAGGVRLNPRMASPMLWKDQGSYQEAIAEFYRRDNRKRAVQTVRLIFSPDKDFPSFRLSQKTLLPGWGFIKGYKKIEHMDVVSLQEVRRIEGKDVERVLHFLSDGLAQNLAEQVKECDLTARGPYLVLYRPGFRAHTTEQLEELIKETDPIVQTMLRR